MRTRSQFSLCACARRSRLLSPRIRAAALALAALLGASGCGGGGGGEGVVPGGNNGAQSGSVVLGITDAPGDFLTYLVDVRSIRLERANGDVVETIPLSTRIDFAELTDLTELLTVATVPTGNYTAVTMTLDYSSAEIVVEDDAGAPVEATPVDTSGNALTTLEVRVELDDADVVRIAAGIAAHVTLDFDLEASNDVDLSGTPPEVTVQPFLLVSAELDADREHRVRGLLDEVDETNGQVTLDVRPFRHRQRSFGEFTFDTSSDTRFEIDGESLVGAAGLAALAEADDGTPVVAKGEVDNRVLTADVVLAGTSVPGNGDRVDVVRGVVAARTDNELTVKGGLLDLGDRPSVFRGSVKVLVGDGTRVTAPGLMDGDVGIDALSIGSRVVVVGDAIDENELDATEGHVHLSISDLAGEVVSTNPLVVALESLDHRRPESFDFAGTGSTPEDDADPAAYEIDTGTLGLPDVAAGDLLRARGLIADFGEAPPDFHARTVIDVDLESRLGVFFAGWPGGTAEPFTTLAPDRIDLDLTDARHELKLFGVPHDFLNPDDLALVAPSGRGLYAVAIRGERSIRLFRDFADLVAALDDALADGDKLTRLTAQGSYNSAAGELTTRRASFELVAP